MWSFASNAIAGSLRKKAQPSKCSLSNPDCSDDDVSSCASREEGLECPICWESFNLVENVPYVLWCGHTMCKNCILGLQWAVVKFPTLPIQLPLFISCPWCNVLSFRLVYKGNLKFPRKNYFLLWMVESMNGERAKFHSPSHKEHHSLCPSSGGSSSSQHHRRTPAVRAEGSSARDTNVVGNTFNTDNISASLQKLMVCFIQLTAKFPLVIIFLLIVGYAVPASAAVLVLKLSLDLASVSLLLTSTEESIRATTQDQTQPKKAHASKSRIGSCTRLQPHLYAVRSACRGSLPVALSAFAGTSVAIVTVASGPPPDAD